ncbi:META domain-containing protein [uncultured Acetobacteroides sp.]|uniref:META domain-containing protein n=1 Tax=uncultured Acetobacteroides sp. TaxID=1760811 RepID=UPI0029F472D6|nr:META domain-containing protein [uncultured Acetobacteroides sp.]
MKAIVTLLALVAALGGCASFKGGSTSRPEAAAVVDTLHLDTALLYAKTWNMVRIESGDRSIDVPAGEEATLVFDPQTSRIHGTCCNRYFGAFTLRGNVVTFDRVGATKMLCTGAIGDVERLYRRLLAAPLAATVDESTLVLKSDQGTITFKAGKVAK